MKFITNVDKKEYEKFNKSHFMQSYAWGVFQGESNNRIPHFVGVTDKNNNLIASALLLEKKLYFGYSYFYSPRGLNVNYEDEKLLSFFTKELKKYIKTKKGIFLKIDPAIVISKYNNKDEKLAITIKKDIVIDNLQNLGYKHLGFTQEFELSQPRYTYRIDLSQGEELVLNNFNKTTKKRINLSKNLETEIIVSGIKDLDKFFELMKETETRKGFLSYDYKYYENLFKIYSQDHDIKLFLGYFYPKRAIKYYKLRVSELDNLINKAISNPKGYKESKFKELNNQKDQCLEKIKSLKLYLKTYGDKILLNAHVIIFHHDKAWALYAGNKDELQETGTNYQVYEEHILYALRNGYQVYDHFGAPGPNNKNKEIAGIAIMKKGFGGDYVEFLGEWDLVTNKLLYFVFLKLIPIYRKTKRNIVKLTQKKAH